MLLPNDLQRFPHPALIVTSDSVHAKFWFAHELELNLLDEISMPRERKTDDETSFVNVDTGAGSSPEPSDDDRLLHFVKAVAKQIGTLADEHKIEHLNFIMPAEIRHRVLEHLGGPVKSKENLHADADLMKEHIVEAIRRLF